MKLSLHHSGFVVKDIETWEMHMVFHQKLGEVIDPVQKAKLSLYSNFSNSFIELIQPLDEASFTWKSLQKFGNHFNHFCYELDSESEVLQAAELYRLIPVLGPVEALLFENRTVFFYYTRNKQIIEFLI